MLYFNVNPKCSVKFKIDLNTSHVIFQLTQSAFKDPSKCNLNTSHVIFQHYLIHLYDFLLLFKYIPCYISTLPISNHTLISLKFKYIPCYISTNAFPALLIYQYTKISIRFNVFLNFTSEVL